MRDVLTGRKSTMRRDYKCCPSCRGTGTAEGNLFTIDCGRCLGQGEVRI